MGGNAFVIFTLHMAFVYLKKLNTASKGWKWTTYDKLLFVLFSLGTSTPFRFYSREINH